MEILRLSAIFIFDTEQGNGDETLLIMRTKFLR